VREMSEELIQRKLTKSGIRIWKYEYYNTSRTNLNSFKKYKIIPSKVYGPYGKREPDGLLVDRSDKKRLEVIAVREFKQPKEFTSEVQKLSALRQCNDLCQVLGAYIGVVTDGQSHFWINPRHRDEDNDYLDGTTRTKRSYTIIRNEDKKYLSEPFELQNISQKDYDKLDEATKNTLYYVERILSSVDQTNSTLRATEEVDPLRLAQAVWQDIYINTAKSPVKCLYNVVELFIFKFLSDLGVLKNPYDFEFVLQLSKDKGAREALEYYARNPREKIRKELFPPGKDKTTIINGTIFVDAKGNPVDSQANLFKTSIKKYCEFGSLRNIKKEFKTKLFETFLKQTSDKNKLGQFFTPRKVVRAMVDMAGVETLPPGARLCDPFCGVGGFIVETIQKPARKRDFFPDRNARIEPKVKYLGFDKGTDEDDERIIILAKANMLIYLSDIVEKHPTYTEEFSKVFNDTFKYLTESNLGTLKEMFDREEDKFDLILTNPPYITSGVSSIKDEIMSDGLQEFYTAGGKGVDGLALEWIIKNLKKGGKALVVIRDGILNSVQNKGLKKLIRNQCVINGIISLPVKTFFNTPQKTYILIITKKFESQENQIPPVFTYLVSDIGETLDVYRFETEGKSDLQKAVELFNAFKGCPESFPIEQVDDLRCKLQPIQRFDPELNWDIDRWWTKQEKIDLGVEEQENLLAIEEYVDRISEIPLKITDYNKVLVELKKETTLEQTKEEAILKLFDPKKGKSEYTRKYIRDHPGEHPVYSSQTVNDGIIGRINSYDYDSECLTWTTDGVYAGTVFYRSGKFSMTTHCGALMLKQEFQEKIDLKYVYYYLRKRLREYAIGEGNKRVTVNVMKNVLIEIPIDERGQFDIRKQKEIALKYERISVVKKDLLSTFQEVSSLDIDVK
jgi:type I restriction enzyme M protein